MQSFNEDFKNVTEKQFIEAIKFCQENYKHIRQATTP